MRKSIDCSLSRCFRSYLVSRRIRRLSLAALGLWALLPTVVGRRVVIINTSPSVAPGLYLRSECTPTVGRIVDFTIPPLAKPYIRLRTGCDGAHWYILKPIAAGPGDRVDTLGRSVLIDGHKMGPMPPTSDEAGRLLPRWRANRVLRSNEYFVFSARIPNSFDSRCYGPITRQEIASVRTPLVTW